MPLLHFYNYIVEIPRLISISTYGDKKLMKSAVGYRRWFFYMKNIVSIFFLRKSGEQSAYSAQH